MKHDGVGDRRVVRVVMMMMRIMRPKLVGTVRKAASISTVNMHTDGRSLPAASIGLTQAVRASCLARRPKLPSGRLHKPTMIDRPSSFGHVCLEPCLSHTKS